MNASLLVIPLCGAIVLVGLLLAVGLGVVLNRALRSNTTATPATAALASTAAGVAAFVIWFVAAWVVFGLLANFTLSRM